MNAGTSCRASERGVLVAQIGARRHYAVPRALHAAGLLDVLVTDACADVAPWRWLDLTWPRKLRPELLRRMLERRVAAVPSERIRGLPWFVFSTAWQRNGDSPTDAWTRRNAAFCRSVARHGFGQSDVVYAFNGAALEIFQAARGHGILTVLDQTAAPWCWNANVLGEERRRWPDWEPHPAEIDESGRLSEREAAEWAMADRIVCGSHLAVDALAESGGPGERCSIVPYPAPADIFAFRHGRVRGQGRRSGPLRVLFVGSLQLRKGVQYLWRAKRALGESVVVRLVGPSALSEPVMRDLRRSMEVTGARPRQEIAEHLAWADVFVLPSLSEGAANVCYEAMAAGVPVVTTANAGSLVRHGETGWLVPPRDSQALVHAFERLAAEPELGDRLAANAVRVMRHQTLERYGAALAEAIEGLTRCSQPDPM